jgi:single-strand DNA-binding protein
MLARFELIGRATKDTELVDLPNGTKKATMFLAVNHKEETYFFNVIAFGKQAELVGKYVGKGKQVWVDGAIKPRSYEKDGKKFYATDFVANNIEFLGNSGKVDNSNGATETNISPTTEELPF